MKVSREVKENVKEVLMEIVRETELKEKEVLNKIPIEKVVESIFLAVKNKKLTIQLVRYGLGDVVWK